jgi:pimeloyl-ACP methyl ester carboxylesterase
MRSLVIMACCLLLNGTVTSQVVTTQQAAASATQYVEIDGNKIGYRTIGSGRPLILLTRLRGTLDTWDPLFLDHLAQTHRVITLDYPGTGYSSGTLPTDLGQLAAFVKAFTTKIGVTRFAVLGWSWGGIVSQAVMLRYPEAISHAVLVGTAPPGPERAEIQQVWLERALKPINDLDDEEILFFEPKSESSRRAAKMSRDRIYARPDVVSKIPSKPSEFQAFFNVADAFRVDTLGLRGQLTKSSVPILILCGDNDPSVPATNWYPLIGQIPRAQLLVLPQSGHGPQHQYPELSAKYIVAFLQNVGD